MKSLFKDILISLHQPTLSINKVLAVSYGKDENEEIEIEYEELAVNDYQISTSNDDIFIEITKEFAPDYQYHFLVKTLQMDGTEEEYIIKCQARGKDLVIIEKPEKR